MKRPSSRSLAKNISISIDDFIHSAVQSLKQHTEHLLCIRDCAGEQGGAGRELGYSVLLSGSQSPTREAGMESGNGGGHGHRCDGMASSPNGGSPLSL